MAGHAASVPRTVREMVEAMGRVAGPEAVRRVRWKPDARIEAIVRTWPVRFATPRALQMGFRADPDVESMIRDYVADENLKLG